jgi:hypothetical protein
MENRRAPGTAAWENPIDDESSLSVASGFSQATGDSIACRSAFKKRDRSSDSAFTTLRLGAFASLRSFPGR